MQPYKFEEIVDRAAEKKQLTAENKEIMKSIGLHMFSEAKKEMSLFKNISIVIPGLIIIFYGKKRLENFKEKVEADLRGEKIYKMSFIEGKDRGFLEELREKVNNLLRIYEVYITDKKITKQAYKQSKLKN